MYGGTTYKEGFTDSAELFRIFTAVMQCHPYILSHIAAESQTRGNIHGADILMGRRTHNRRSVICLEFLSSRLLNEHPITAPQVASKYSNSWP
jgi:hypothetical protein